MELNPICALAREVVLVVLVFVDDPPDFAVGEGIVKLPKGLFEVAIVGDAAIFSPPP